MSRSPNHLFTELQQQYYQAWFRFHPVKAVDAGVIDYAGELKSYDDDDIGALIALNQKLVCALDEMNINELGDTEHIDYRILRGAAEIELHDLEERDWRFRNPADFVPINAIYQLLIYPIKDVHSAIRHRLQRVPEYLRGARILLSQSAEHVVPVWLETAVSLCRSGSCFVRDMSRHPLITQKFTNPSRLQPLFDDAAHALDEFATFLEVEIGPRAKGDFACGAYRYKRLLNEKHFMDTTPEAILALGEKLFKQTQQALIAHTKTMQGDENVEGLLQKIQQRHPQSGQLLDSYRKRMKTAYEQWSKSEIIPVPEQQSLKVQATPEFLRHVIPFAAYQHPLPTDPGQHGLYYVTPVSDDRLLAEHNDFSIDLTCVHEAFPGHHLQFVTEHGLASTNYTRLVNASASMYEGWALYCEQLAIEQGMLDSDEHRFVMLRDRLWRALRVIIDVKLQTGQLSIARAVELMMAELGFSREQAEAEINWYTSSPTVPMCYATGCELILAARNDVVANSGVELAEFHNRLLQQGSIALPLGLRQAFGESVWRSAHTAVFSPAE